MNSFLEIGHPEMDMSSKVDKDYIIHTIKSMTTVLVEERRHFFNLHLMLLSCL